MAGPSHLGRVHRTALAASIPLSVHLEFTHACNLACGFCCNPPHDDRNPLDFDHWVLVLDDLRELGTLMITITGGEPLCHPHFDMITSAVRDRRFALRILSNGTLIDDVRARGIAALHPLAVEISIHGNDDATHDRVTGVVGSFRAAWLGIDRLQQQGVRVVVKTPITRLNIRQTAEIADHAQKKGLPVRFDPTITPRDDGCAAPTRFAAEPDDIRDLMGRKTVDSPEALLRRAGGVNCGLGRSTLTVDPAGEVYPCSQWRTSSLGNVRADRLTDIWRASGERRRVRAIARAANDHLIAIGGAAAEYPYCPAVAARTTGNPLEPDAVFLSLAEIAHSLRRNP